MGGCMVVVVVAWSRPADSLRQKSGRGDMCVRVWEAGWEGVRLGCRGVARAGWVGLALLSRASERTHAAHGECHL